MWNLSLVKVNLHKITRLVMSRIYVQLQVCFSQSLCSIHPTQLPLRVDTENFLYSLPVRELSPVRFFLGPYYAQKDLISEKAWVFFVVEINEVLQDVLHLSKRTYGSLYFCKSAANILNQRIFTFHKTFSIHFIVSSWWFCPSWANTHLECFYSSINPKGKY